MLVLFEIIAIFVLPILFIGTYIFMILYPHFREEVYSEKFYWDTWDGIVVCSATLYKIKHLNIYFTEFTGSHRGHEDHPKYKKFLKKCEELKNKKRYTT